MTDTIREQIITAIESKLAIVDTDNGYQTDCGRNVFRGLRSLDPDVEALNIFPKPDIVDRDYGTDRLIMPVHVEGFKLFGNDNPSEVGEKLLGDIIEAIAGRRWVLDFTSGGSYQPRPGETIEGASSGATGFIESVDRTSGSWAGGTAAGTITIRRKSGTFESENLNIGNESNVATTDGTIVYASAVETTTGDLADDIVYDGGGPEDYPEGGQTVIGVLAVFNIVYPVVAGDPYTQP